MTSLQKQRWHPWQTFNKDIWAPTPNRIAFTLSEIEWSPARDRRLHWLPGARCKEIVRSSSRKVSGYFRSFRQTPADTSQRGSKGWQKGVWGRGSASCLFQFGRETSIKIERSPFSILWNIDYFVCFIDKSETRVFTFVFVKKKLVFFDLLKSIIFCGREQHWDRMRPAHFWKERRGTLFFPEGLQKIVKKT